MNPNSYHISSAEAVQQWLWKCGSQGWDPGQPKTDLWSHDDNMAAQPLGWMIINPPGSSLLDLFSLVQYDTPYELMKNIMRMAPIDPLCEKAVIVLTRQKLLYPDHRFAFNEGPM